MGASRVVITNLLFGSGRHQLIERHGARSPIGIIEQPGSLNRFVAKYSSCTHRYIQLLSPVSPLDICPRVAT